MRVDHSWWGTAFERFAELTPVRLVVLRWEGGDDAVVEWTNPASAALVGISADEAAGRRVSDVYPPEYLPEVVEQLRRAEEDGSYSYEVVRELPAGRLTLEAIAIAIGEGRFLGAALDRTEEHEARRRLEEVTRLTGAGLYHWNVVEDVLHWSDELFGLLGYEPGAVEPTVELYLEHVHPEHRAAVQQVTATARANQPTTESLRHPIRRVDGEERTIDVRVRSVADDTGRLLYLVGVVRDVTSEIELERHAQLAQRAAEQQRTALTLHERVVQSLATVVLALDLDQPETAREEALAAAAAAQRVVADLLAEVGEMQGEVGPGDLRVQPPTGSAP